jgi:hypothetical protein
MAIEVVRPFMLEGKRVEIGTVLELDRKQERELCHYGKARPVAAQPAPADPEPAKRGKKDPP